MAVAFDATSNAKTNSAASLTWNHTVGSNANRVLLVGVSLDPTLLDHFVSGVTYGGVALTHLVTKAIGTSTKVSLWYLVAPASGTASIVVSFDAAVTAVAGACSFDGADQDQPIADYQGNTGSDTTPTVNVVGDNTGEMAMDAVAIQQTATSPTTLTVGAGQTQRWNAQAGGIGSPKTQGAGSTEPGAVGAITMSWSLGAAKDWAIVAAIIRPLAACDGGRSSGLDIEIKVRVV